MATTTARRRRTAPPAIPAPDEKQQAAVVVAERQAARRDGPDLQPQTKLDSDLRHLSDSGTVQRAVVSSPRRRRPNEIPVLYSGCKKGALHDQHVDVLVPDEENAAWVDTLRDVIDPGVGSDGKPAPEPDLSEMHGRGPHYHFKLGEATLVDAEDLPFILSHHRWNFQRTDHAPGDRTEMTPERRQRRTG